MLQNKKTRFALILIAPAIIVILAVNLYPIIYSLHLSMFDIRGLVNRGFVGIQNYISLITHGRLIQSIRATAIFTFGTVILQTVLGMIFALALNVKFKGQSVVRTLIIIPWAIPTALGALMWRRFLDPTDGFINASLRALNLLEGQINWFLNPALAMLTVIWVDTWKMTPLYTLIFLAALKAIPNSIYESAEIDGANKIQKFFYLTLPILKPVILVVLILRTMLVFHAFDVIFILTGGGPGDSTRVLAYYAYQEAFQYMRHGRGAAMAVLLFVLILIITSGYLLIGKISGQEKEVV